MLSQTPFPVKPETTHHYIAKCISTINQYCIVLYCNVLYPQFDVDSVSIAYDCPATHTGFLTRIVIDAVHIHFTHQLSRKKGIEIPEVDCEVWKRGCDAYE